MARAIAYGPGRYVEPLAGALFSLTASRLRAIGIAAAITIVAITTSITTCGDDASPRYLVSYGRRKERTQLRGDSSRLRKMHEAQNE
jgi:hypothetical protein